MRSGILSRDGAGKCLGVRYGTAAALCSAGMVGSLVAGGKNVGECGVLAMGQVYKSVVVMDDATPRRIAQEKGIQVLATVPLLCAAIRDKKLTTVMVEDLADTLLQSDYYLPFGPGGFRQHVMENGLLDYDEL